MGVDPTPAPLGDVSIGAAIETYTGAKFGSSGTMTAALIITTAVKAVPVKQVGYSGLMVPVMEDKLLARRWAEGTHHHGCIARLFCGLRYGSRYDSLSWRHRCRSVGAHFRRCRVTCVEMAQTTVGTSAAGGGKEGRRRLRSSAVLSCSIPRCTKHHRAVGAGRALLPAASAGHELRRGDVSPTGGHSWENRDAVLLPRKSVGRSGPPSPPRSINTAHSRE